MKLLLTLIGCGLTLGAVAWATTTPLPAVEKAPLSKPVIVNIVFWDQERGFQSIKENLRYISEVNPFWYTVDRSGRVVPYRDEAGKSYEDAEMVDYLHKYGIKVVPTIANTHSNDIWPRDLVVTNIATTNKRQKHIQNIVDLTIRHQYDGINLDYENLDSNDRELFSIFVEELAAALHTHGKILNVDVYAKTSEPGTWDGPQAQDYARLARSADKLVIMLYNYHWGTSSAGPITPAFWERDVLAFAARTIPEAKLYHSLPLFGYNWVGKDGTDYTWSENMAIARSAGAQIKWHPNYQASWYTYRQNNTLHEVWFEDARSTAAHLERSLTLGAGGISLWRLGGEDPATWQIIEKRLLIQPVQNSVNER